jgi:hypothetical protein
MRGVVHVPLTCISKDKDTSKNGPLLWLPGRRCKGFEQLW